MSYLADAVLYVIGWIFFIKNSTFVYYRGTVRDDPYASKLTECNSVAPAGTYRVPATQ
jgi:hypothetical protein